MRVIACSILALLLAALPLPAAPPSLLSYHGQLEDSAGAPVTSATTLRFTLLWGGTANQVVSTGKPVYQEDVVLTPDANGVFAHEIGSGAATNGCDENRDGAANELCVLEANDFPDAQTVVYIEVRVDPAGTNNPLLPRHRVASVGYAMSAGTVDGQNAVGLVSNLGLVLSGGTLSVTDASGAPLSAQNTGYVTVPSAPPLPGGRSVTLKVSAPFSIKDSNSGSMNSDLKNFGFGITEARAWPDDMPFFLYVANKNNSSLDGSNGSSAFFLARSFAMNTTPTAAGDVGNTDAAPANPNQDAILLLGSFSPGDYVGLPCQLVGVVRMRWLPSDWTIQSLGNSDGIGTAQLAKGFSTTWTFPQGQNGAFTSATYLKQNGAGNQVPGFSGQNFEYTIAPSGEFRIYVNLSGAAIPDGTGAVNTLLTVPYKIRSLRFLELGWWIRMNAVDRPGGFDFTTGNDYLNINAFTVTGGQVNAVIDSPRLNEWTGGDRRIFGSAVFKAYR